MADFMCSSLSLVNVDLRASGDSLGADNAAVKQDSFKQVDTGLLHRYVALTICVEVLHDVEVECTIVSNVQCSLHFLRCDGCMAGSSYPGHVDDILGANEVEQNASWGEGGLNHRYLVFKLSLLLIWIRVML